jgi:hypothetical protein
MSTILELNLGLDPRYIATAGVDARGPMKIALAMFSSVCSTKQNY